MTFRTTAILLAMALASFGQGQNSRVITASGEATASANPDQAMIVVSVSNSAGTANDAASQNAVQTSNVISVLKSLISSSDLLQTLSYTLQPNYNNQGSITGYTATNTLQVTTYDLTLIGKLIDAAASSGATRVQAPTFGVRDSQALRAKALKAAAAVAITQVQAIAAGLGVKTGNIVSASDSTSTTVTGVLAGAAATVTPIISGPVNVTASVRIAVEIQQ